MENLFFYYTVVVSFILFILMYVDKSRAKKHDFRISEKTLWIFAIIGGACGGFIGMYVFRHKTKHITFKIGFPLLSIVQIYIIMKLSSFI